MGPWLLHPVVTEVSNFSIAEAEEEDEDADIYKLPETSEQDLVEEAMAAGKEARFVSHVPIPTQKDVQDALLRRKKQELLREYNLDDDDMEESKE